MKHVGIKRQLSNTYLILYRWCSIWLVLFDCLWDSTMWWDNVKRFSWDTVDSDIFSLSPVTGEFNWKRSYYIVVLEKNVSSYLISTYHKSSSHTLMMSSIIIVYTKMGAIGMHKRTVQYLTHNSLWLVCLEVPYFITSSITHICQYFKHSNYV